MNNENKEFYFSGGNFFNNLKFFSFKDVKELEIPLNFDISNENFHKFYQTEEKSPK